MLFSHAEISEIQTQAEKGDIWAIYYLSLIYEAGKYVERDLEYSHALKLSAAENGHAEAQYSLGRDYLLGINIKRNELEAFKWLHSAANDYGFVMAIFNLIEMLGEGFGTERNLVESYKWWLVAGHLSEIDLTDQEYICYVLEGMTKGELERARSLASNWLTDKKIEIIPSILSK